MYLIAQFCLLPESLPHLLVAEPIASEEASPAALEQILRLLEGSGLLAEPELILDELPEDVAEFAPVTIVQRQSRGPWFVHSPSSPPKTVLGKPLAFAFAKKAGLLGSAPSQPSSPQPVSSQLLRSAHPPAPTLPVQASSRQAQLEAHAPGDPVLLPTVSDPPSDKRSFSHPLETSEYLDDPDDSEENDGSDLNGDQTDTDATALVAADESFENSTPSSEHSPLSTGSPTETVYPVVGSSSSDSESLPAQSSNSPASASAPPSSSPLTKTTEIKFVASNEPYEPGRATITLTVQLMPDDGNPLGRLVIVGARSHNDPPVFDSCRLSELPLPPRLEALLQTLVALYPARQSARRNRLTTPTPTAKPTSTPKNSTSKKGKQASKPEPASPSPLPPLSQLQLGAAPTASPADQLAIFSS